MLSKVKKMLLMILGSVAITCVALIPNTKVTNQNTINSYWYNNLNNTKFEIRDQLIIKEWSPNGELINKSVNNDFELKLLLNPGFETDNEDFIRKFNNDFINKVTNSNLVFSESTSSRIMPIVLFYFKTESDRELFVNHIKNWREIYKIIIYKNEDINQGVWGNDPGFDYYRRAYSHLNIAPNKNLNNFKQSVEKNVGIIKADVGLLDKRVGKIGVLEVGNEKFDDKYKEFFRGGIKIKQDLVLEPNSPIDEHGIMVSMIAGSQFGVDRSSSVYLSKFLNYKDWQEAIEKMIIDNGVRIINHSYGPNYNGDKTNYYKLYEDKAYYLDYISRKYGVINFVSAGNDGNKTDHQITKSKLSFNSIIVGSLDKNASEYNLKTNKVVNTSNYKLNTQYENLAKPLVVAPGFYNNIFYQKGVKDSHEIINGTSFSTPLVAGLVSNFLKKYPEINKTELRVPIIKAILSASAVTPQLSELKYKSSGYEQKYGAGTPDGIKMHEAARNYRTISVKPTKETGTVFTSNEIFLNINQTIKVSSSWTFNAGVLKKIPSWESYQTNYNWWTGHSNLPGSLNSEEDEIRKFWNKIHDKEFWPKFNETIKYQGHRWFTDYDLFLEYKESTGKWVEIKRVFTVASNDELIEHKATKAGAYRYVIKKYSSSEYTNSVDDLVAVTHVVRNENN